MGYWQCELDENNRGIVLTHVGAGTFGTEAIVYQLEWSLLRRLQTRSEPMSIEGAIQPLAWDPQAWDLHSDDECTLLSFGAMR